MNRAFFERLSTLESTVYLVGGAIRQRLLNQPIDDYDFVLLEPVIPVVADLAKEFGCSWVVLDKQRDIARLILKGLSFDFAPILGDLESDLACRDLSINAMAAPVQAAQLMGECNYLRREIIDPWGGWDDIQKRRIRGLSCENFRSDPLRMIRVFRFAASLNFSIEHNTLQWISQFSTAISQVAKERITYEFAKLLAASDSVRALSQMPEEMTQILFQSDANEWLARLRNLSQLETDLKQTCPPEVMACLKTKFADRRSELIALKIFILADLGRSENELSKQLTSLVLSRQELDVLAAWKADVCREPRFYLSDPVRLLELYQRHKKHIQGLSFLWHLYFPEQFAEAARIRRGWLESDNILAHPPVLINGGDVMQALQIQPGPRIGQVLKQVQVAQARGQVSTRNEALQYLQSLGPNDCE